MAVLRPTWGAPEEVGAVVSVIRRASVGEELTMRSGQSASCKSDFSWFCESRVTEEFPCFVDDRHLRPIRGMFGTDETLTWADVPRKEHA